jgi:hypothetical protein
MTMELTLIHVVLLLLLSNDYDYGHGSSTTLTLMSWAKAGPNLVCDDKDVLIQAGRAACVWARIYRWSSSKTAA